MKILSLDLEFNQPSNKIVQIGAVIGETDSGAILDRFSVFINPEEPLNPFIISLTGIEQKDVDQGDSILDAYLKLKDFFRKHECGICNPLTFGGGDSKELQDQIVKYFEMNQLDRTQIDWPFGRRWIDAKTVFQAYQLANNHKIQAGLKKACNKIGVTFEGPAHDALQDALNTFKLYCALLRKFKTV